MDLDLIVVWEELDYMGGIVKKTITGKIKWENYNPEQIILHQLQDGDFSHVPPPVSIQWYDLINKHLDWSTKNRVIDPILVETNYIQQGYKYVFKKFDKVIGWVKEDATEIN